MLPEYWIKDQLSVLPPRRCETCRKCADSGKCSETHQLRTLKEEAELQMISDKVKIIDGRVQVEYPFIKNPAILKNNRHVAIKVAEKLWRDLKKDGLIEAYHGEMRKYLDRGTFVKLTDSEKNEYEGPHQWITHHGVLKNSSTSTPLRVVTNSSFRNGASSLNACLPRGPKSINDLFNITLRFRSYERVFAFDLDKAYNTMHTGVVERNLRRFVWRWEESEPWQDFAIDKVHFGDGPAACQLEVSKQKTAELGKSIDEEASKKMIDDSYVDDTFSGGNKESIDRMVGVVQEDGNYNGTISQILALGGFKVKAFAVEYDMSQPDENLLGNSVFGYGWNPKSGIMCLNFKVNLSKKKRGARIGPDLTLDSISSLSTMSFTKRNLLGVTNSFGDYLGVAEPFTLRFRLGMKTLTKYEPRLDWDDELPASLRPFWETLLAETILTGCVEFPRTTRPDNSIGGPVIGGLADGNDLAYGCCVYLIWEFGCNGNECVSIYCKTKDGGHFSSAFLCGKSRITPLHGYTVPRSELSAATLLYRMLKRVVQALVHIDVKPQLVIPMLDSKCTISLLDDNSRSLKPFFQNRVAEIRDNMDDIRKICPLEEPHYIESSLNVADLVTKGKAKIDDIKLGSLWQTGPSFFTLPRNAWPITRDFVRLEPPQEEVKPNFNFMATNLESVSSGTFAKAKISPCMDSIKLSGRPAILFSLIEGILSYSNNFGSRVRVVARIIRGWNNKMIKDGDDWNTTQLNLIGNEPVRDELVAAEKVILKHGMVTTSRALKEGKLSSLLPMVIDGIIYTRGRLGEKSMEALLGVTKLPILMPNSRLAELYMWRAHNGFSGLFHRSVSETLAKSRASVWIVKGNQVAKRICSQCMTCRKLRKNPESQQMAELKEESSQVCPPWTYVCLDYAGPVFIKGEINAKSRGKGWILCYTCRSTKAVCLLVTAGYSTSHFLTRHEEFVARKGKPRSIVTDRGTQLVKGGIVLSEKEKPSNWNWAEVVSKNSVTDWKFAPIGSPHYNGLSESTVKILKRSLSLAINPGVILSFSEMVTLLAKISHSINCRPLGIDSVSGDSQQEHNFIPITPNHLLLGRSGEDSPPLDYEEDSPITARLAYVSAVYETWWKYWIKQVLPSLIPTRKWKVISRNINVGDVCLMSYLNNLKDDYRLVKVTEVMPDGRGLVRTVKIVYRKKMKNEPKDAYWKRPLVEEEVSVRRLSILVSVNDQ